MSDLIERLLKWPGDGQALREEAAAALREQGRALDIAHSELGGVRINMPEGQRMVDDIPGAVLAMRTELSEAKAENERLTRERDAFFDSLRQLICINSVLTALRSTAPLWLEHAERLIDERNALDPKGGDNDPA